MKYQGFEFNELTNDSRKVNSNTIYVAIEGFSQDGHRFVETALLNGAVAAIIRKDHPLAYKLLQTKKCIGVDNTRKILAELASEIHNNPSHKMKVCAVTGTNGKTTSTYLLESILKTSQLNPAVIGTVENRFQSKVIPTEHTTPDAISLQKLLNDFQQAGAKSVAIEVSSHALDQYRVWATKFESALFTNLTQDHLDYHLTMENYFQSKLKLFTEYNVQTRVIHNVSEYGKRIIEECNKNKLKCISFGVKDADINYSKFQCSSTGIDLSLEIFGKQYHLFSKTLGAYNVENLAGSVATGVGIGLPIDKVIEGASKASSAPGRLEPVENYKGLTVLVDYAHSPDALEKALSTLRAITKGKLICVFGCGGDRDKTKRPIMAQIANKLSDVCVITSDNPRTENPKSIIDDIKSGLTDSKKAHIEIDREKAIKWAIENSSTNDVILIAGKGHENYQIIGSEKFHFDDREVAKKYLSQ